MGINIDFKKSRRIIHQTLNIPSNTVLGLAKQIEGIEVAKIDFKKGVVFDQALYDEIISINLYDNLSDFSTSGEIPLEIFLNLFMRLVGLDNEDTSLFDILAKSTYFKDNHQLKDALRIVALTQDFESGKKSWITAARESEKKDWHHINLFSRTLPLSKASLEDFKNWITLIHENKEFEGILNNVASYVNKWVILDDTIALEVDSHLEEISTNPKTCRFLASIIKGLQDRTGELGETYLNRLKPLINTSNSFEVFYALGMVCSGEVEIQNKFYELLLQKVNDGTLPVFRFISLCSFFKLYRLELFKTIEDNLPHTNDTELILSIIGLIQNDTDGKIDNAWIDETYVVLFSKHGDDIESHLNYLMSDILEKDLDKAYRLYEFRIEVMAHMNLLDCIVSMARKDPQKFQKFIIRWFLLGDKYVHTALRVICSTYGIENKYFEIPKDVFEGVSNYEREYMAFKVVGYIYSMEPLQLLILSIIKSIENADEEVTKALQFIVREYLVYNYRSTLDLMRISLKEHNLQSFAKTLFEETVAYFENYFEQLRSIRAGREIRPSKQNVILQSFYRNKAFSEVPKKARENSIMNYARNVEVNSNKWAIRREGELIHTPQKLGHFSYSMEFPSGENLNPIFQENIRRTYQNLAKQ